MKKGGAPTKEKKKNKYISFRVNDDEYEQLNKLLKKSSYNKMSDLTRDILLNNRYNVVALDDNMLLIRTKLLVEIRRIGNNFNQLIKSFNQKKTDSFTKDEIGYIINSMKNIEYIYSKIEENIKQ